MKKIALATAIGLGLMGSASAIEVSEDEEYEIQYYLGWADEIKELSRVENSSYALGKKDILTAKILPADTKVTDDYVATVDDGYIEFAFGTEVHDVFILTDEDCLYSVKVGTDKGYLDRKIKKDFFTDWDYVESVDPINSVKIINADWTGCSVKLDAVAYKIPK